MSSLWWNDETKKLERLEEWPREEEIGRNDLAAHKEPTGYSGQAADRSPGSYVNLRDYVTKFPESKAAQICDSAAKLIDGEKHKEHGDRKETFTRAASMWSAYLGAKVEPHDVAWMMVLLKISREGNGSNPDNYLDAVGYAAIAGELAEGEHGC